MRDQGRIDRARLRKDATGDAYQKALEAVRDAELALLRAERELAEAREQHRVATGEWVAASCGAHPAPTAP